MMNKHGSFYPCSPKSTKYWFYLHFEVEVKIFRKLWLAQCIWIRMSFRFPKTKTSWDHSILILSVLSPLQSGEEWIISNAHSNVRYASWRIRRCGLERIQRSFPCKKNAAHRNRVLLNHPILEVLKMGLAHAMDLHPSDLSENGLPLDR